MGASGAVHLMLCVLTVTASLQAATAAGRGGRTLLQGGAATPDAALPAFVSQVRRRLPRQNVPSREVTLALLGLAIGDNCAHGELQGSCRSLRPTARPIAASSACS